MVATGSAVVGEGVVLLGMLAEGAGAAAPVVGAACVLLGARVVLGAGVVGAAVICEQGQQEGLNETA